jgi:peptide/nickel transport system permease protein
MRGLRTLSRRGQVGACLLCAIALAAALAPLLAPADPLKLDGTALLRGPSLAHPLGTDPYGRDTLARVLYGGRRSLLVAAASALVALLGGAGGGLLAGYYGGIVDSVLSRLTDVLLSLPAILLCLAVLAFLGDQGTSAGDAGGTWHIVLAIGLIYAGPMLRVTRAAVLAIRRETYLEASRCSGASDARILVHTVLPNAAGPILVELCLRLGYALIAEASLAFLGLGTAPPAPSWGELIADGRRYLLLSPWTAIAPGVLIVLTVLGCNLLGDGLHQAISGRPESRA